MGEILMLWEAREKKKEENKTEEVNDGVLSLEEQAKKNKLQQEKLASARTQRNAGVSRDYKLQPRRPPAKKPGNGGSGGGGNSTPLLPGS